MRIRVVSVVAALACLSSGTPARASSFVASIVYVDELTSELVEVPIPLVQVGDTLTISNWVCISACAAGGFSLTNIDVTLDPDPVIAFGASAQDLGAPSSFAFIFSQSIVPTSTPGFVRASLSGSTTNGSGFAGPVSVTPAASPGGIPTDGADQGPQPDEIMVFNLSTNGGTTLLNPGLDLGTAFTSNSGQISDNYPTYNTGFVPGPAGSDVYDFMRVDVNFTLSGGGDTFTFNGDAEVVPEPRTAVLLALGLLGLGARRRHAA